MKKVLITGANSYIGISLEKWLNQWPDAFVTDTVDMIGDQWKTRDFSNYDAVFHVAGIAHVTSDPKLADLYKRVNCDLAVETATKAKAEGVRQFIFMSSIIVYGDSSPVNERRVITKDTPPSPENIYGQSKLDAETGLWPLADGTFAMTILRPPMVYGKGSKGNYPKLARFARKLPVFPDIDNQRSMIYIENLCNLIRLIIQNGDQGTFHPQNAEYVKTSEMVALIAQAHGRKIILTRLFNPILKAAGNHVGIIRKIFGNLVYDQTLSEYPDNYRVRDLASSLVATEGDE